MKTTKHFPAQLGKEQFHCPHCYVYAKQFWAHISASSAYPWNSFVDGIAKFNGLFPGDWSVSKCQHCESIVVWHGKSIVYPKNIPVENPNGDLNADIQADYLEAARVFAESPRASAALLRLALQKLCKQLGEKGDNINDDIAQLVKKGLNPLVQKSLDLLRITANNAVHPGMINVDEEPHKVLKLFEVLNFIADKMLTEPSEISSFYDDLPESAQKAVEKRDKKGDR